MMKELRDRFSALSFVFVLAFFFLGDVVAQIPPKPQTVKDPITVEIANQPDSPVLVSLIGVDTTDDRFQKINFTVQNLSDKPIRGYVLSAGTIETSFFPARPFVKGPVYDKQILIETENIRSNDMKVTIFVDYVAYTDRTGWGDDKEKRSDTISGQASGARFAAAEVAAVMKGSGIAGVETLLIKPPFEAEVPTPPGAEGQSENWRMGFRSGYRSFLHFVKSRYTDPDFSTQLEEARKYID